MTGWFGESWGAPVCDPEDHVPTPVGKCCLECLEPIAQGDQGVTMPLLLEAGVLTCVHHLDCFLKKVRPHGPDCSRCRGKEREQHAPRCRYRAEGGECNCVDLEDV